MKEVEGKIEKGNVKKIFIIIILIILAVVIFFIKHDIDVVWEEIIATTIGFVGVILTIKETEKNRIKQNKFDYQKEKINEEQIEFKKMLKEKVDFLNFITVSNEFIGFDNENFEEGINKVNTYRYKMLLIIDDILWYYDRDAIKNNIELALLIVIITNWVEFYNEKMKELCHILLRYGKEKDYLKIQREQLAVIDELSSYSREKITLLYEQAKKVIEERDEIVRSKIIDL